MHEWEELPMVTGDHVFPAAENEFIGRAYRAQGVAEVKVEQAVAIHLHQFALWQQVLGSPVLVITQTDLRKAAAVGGYGRRSPQGIPRPDKLPRLSGTMEIGVAARP